MKTLEELSAESKTAWDAGEFEVAAALAAQARELVAPQTVNQQSDGTLVVG